MSLPSIIEFTTDPQLLGLSLSAPQETLLRAIYGLPLSQDQLETWRVCTARETYPNRPFGEVTVIAGARAGKDSRIAAPVVLYEAIFGGHERHLSKGEQGMIPVVAQDRRATAIAFGYIREYLEHSPMLSGMIVDVLTSEVSLTNNMTVSCFPCTLRSLRGWSIPVGVLDELGFYQLEGMANSDAEIQTSIRRGQLSFPEPRLVKISTPYLKGGVLFDDFNQYYGKDSPDLLVWKASSELMNPTLKLDRLERLRRLDPQRFAREYLAEFSDDLAAFLSYDWIKDAVSERRTEMPPRDGVDYVAAVDPSGGVTDAFTLSIVHSEGARDEPTIVQDILRGWSGRGSGDLDLRGVVRAIAQLLGRYRVRQVVGDRYAAGWVRQAFEAEGVQYEESKLDRSAAYLEMLPLFSEGRIKLLDDARLVRELQCLERRTRAGGKDMVDHPRGGHDDYANVTALATVATISDRGHLIGAEAFALVNSQLRRTSSWVV